MLLVDIDDLCNFDQKLGTTLRIHPEEYLKIVSNSAILTFVSLRKHVKKCMHQFTQVTSLDFPPSKFRLEVWRTHACSENWIAS